MSRLGFDINVWKNRVSDISNDLDTENKKLKKSVESVKCDCENEQILSCKFPCLKKSIFEFLKGMEEIQSSLENLSYNLTLFGERAKNENQG